MPSPGLPQPAIASAAQTPPRARRHRAGSATGGRGTAKQEAAPAQLAGRSRSAATTLEIVFMSHPSVTAPWFALRTSESCACKPPRIAASCFVCSSTRIASSDSTATSTGPEPAVSQSRPPQRRGHQPVLPSRPARPPPNRASITPSSNPSTCAGRPLNLSSRDMQLQPGERGYCTHRQRVHRVY